MFRKRIIALSFVFVICFSCIAPFAYADDYQSSIVGLWDSFLLMVPKSLKMSLS